MTLDFAFLLAGPQAAQLAAGLATTFRLFAGAWLLAVAFAVALAVLRAAPLRPARWLVAAIVEYHRNVPLMVQVLIWYFGVPQMLPTALRIWVNHQDSEFLFALIALALNTGAFMSEDIRSGIRAIPPTQMEAARSLGLRFLPAMRLVILPQALRIAVPPMLNQTLMLFKNTSLAMAIAVGELTYRVREIESETYRTFEIFLLATVIYLTMSFTLMGLGAWFARRFPPLVRA